MSSSDYIFSNQLRVHKAYHLGKAAVDQRNLQKTQYVFPTESLEKPNTRGTFRKEYRMVCMSEKFHIILSAN